MAVHRKARPVVISSTLVAAWTVWWAWRMWSVSGLSWHFSVDGAGLFLHGSGFNLYADAPWLQTGPLSLVVAALLRPLPANIAKNVALVAMTAAGPLLIAALTPLVVPTGRHRRMILAAIIVIPAWTVLSVRWGHLDDVLTMTFAILALRAVSADRPVLAGIALAAAVATKPWAVGFVPLLLVLPRGRMRATATAVAGTALAWAPFVLANPRTLGALHPPVGLSPSSGLHTLGARGVMVPPWGRSAQLLLSPAAAVAAVLTRGLPGVLLVAVAVRLALDPKDNAYYIGSAALAAVVFDLLGTSWTIPWTTLVTVVVFWQPFTKDFVHWQQSTTGLTHWWFAHQEAVGALHLAWAIAVVVLVFALPPRVRTDPRSALHNRNTGYNIG
ncbi:MAG: hypothetical protein ACYCV4_01260 [Dermatophilaceae bacterium]